MRTPLIAAAAFANVVVTPAVADTWSGAYDGTIESTYADGHVVKVSSTPTTATRSACQTVRPLKEYGQMLEGKAVSR